MNEDVAQNKDIPTIDIDSDDEYWEGDSDTYSDQSVADSDDISSFINDNTTDYESNDDSISEDDS